METLAIQRESEQTRYATESLCAPNDCFDDSNRWQKPEQLL